MKSFLLVLFIALNCSVLSYAQDNACNDKQLHSELVTLNQNFEKQGFSVQQFSTMDMPEKAYVPITVSMKQGKMYQINFLANPDFQNYSMVLIDKDKKELIKIKVKSKNTEEHFTSKSFVAPYTGSYWLILTQKVKGEKSACGGLSILESGK